MPFITVKSGKITQRTDIFNVYILLKTQQIPKAVKISSKSIPKKLKRLQFSKS